jgi:hypothetical protein
MTIRSPPLWLYVIVLVICFLTLARSTGHF